MKEPKTKPLLRNSHRLYEANNQAGRIEAGDTKNLKPDGNLAVCAPVKINYLTCP